MTCVIFTEVAALEVCDLVKFCNLAFGRLLSRNAFLNMESRILQALDFRISGPTSWSFLQRFLTVVNPQQSTKERAHYFLECSLYVEELLDYRPSAVAATVACLAIRNPKSEDIGPESMVRQVGFAANCRQQVETNSSLVTAKRTPRLYSLLPQVREKDCTDH